MIPPVLKNKYIITLSAFVVWMVFFDDRDIVTTHFRHRNELKRLEEGKAYYQQEIDKTRQELRDLQSDPNVLEKYARERYRMKRDNEDIFIVPL